MKIKPGDKVAYRKDPFTEVETHVWPNGHMHSYNVRTGMIHAHSPDGTLLHAVSESNPFTLVPLQERVEGWAVVTPHGTAVLRPTLLEAEKAAKGRDGRLVYLREVPEAEE